MPHAVLQSLDHMLFQGRDEPSLKRETIVAERRERHRKPEIGVPQASFLAISIERQDSFRIVETGGEPFGFQHHPARHLKPAFHRLAEDAEGESALSEVGRDGKAVGAGAQDGHIDPVGHRASPSKIHSDLGGVVGLTDCSIRLPTIERPADPAPSCQMRLGFRTHLRRICIQSGGSGAT